MAVLAPITQTLKCGEHIVIRSAARTDAPRIATLIRECAGDEHLVTEPDEAEAADAEKIAAELAAAELDPQRLRLIALAAGPAPIGLRSDHQAVAGALDFVAPHRRRIAHRGRVGISVAPWARRRGIGSALVTTLLDWARDHPRVEKVRLAVVSTNTGAIEMYQSLGFVEEGRRRREIRLGPDRYADDVVMAVFVKPQPTNHYFT